MVLALALSGCGHQGGRVERTTKALASATEIKLAGGAKGVWAAPAGSPRALLVLIHGGGWSGLSPVAFNSMKEIAKVFQDYGFETLTLDYRKGVDGVADVDTMYRRARYIVGPGYPICAVGVSAGGNVALLLAVRERDLNCVIDLAGPADLTALRSSPAARRLRVLVQQAFGDQSLSPVSPALHAASIRARLLLVYAENDPVVPLAQGEEMKRADPGARLIVLPPGHTPFVHTGAGVPVAASGVSASAYSAARQAELRFLDAAG